MASSSGSGTSSGSSLFQNYGSEEDLQAMMDQRKRKRMISNRESARRSRMRKQKHLDDLMAQVEQLRRESNQIITSMNITTQNYLNIESENSVLRAQVGELSNRLESLNEIINFSLNANNNNNNNNNSNNSNNNGVFGAADQDPNPYNINECIDNNSFFMNQWNLQYLNQPIMASAADIFQY